MHRFKLPAAAVFTLAALAYAAPSARAADTYHLTIKDHRFEPSSVTVPAGKRVKLVIKNLDATPEEFDSTDLHREKVVPGGGEGSLYIGPLSAGTYHFVGEYNEATAKGEIIAK